MKTKWLLVAVDLSSTKQKCLPNIKAFHEDENVKPMIISILLLHHQPT